MMFGNRLARLRRQRGWNQSQLAVRLGVSASTIGMYEQGRREPDCRTLIALAAILEVSTDYLLTGRAPAPDTAALRAGIDRFFRESDASLTLRAADGAERPCGPAELALLLSALSAAQQE